MPGLIGLNLLTMGLFTVGMVTVVVPREGEVPPARGDAASEVGLPARARSCSASTVVVAPDDRCCWSRRGSASRSRTRARTCSSRALVVLGTATFLAMGFALSSFASTVETYAPISNLVFFPMMLLSGVYFRLDSAPQWMQKAVFVLPLSPFLRVLRAVFNDGATLAGHAARARDPRRVGGALRSCSR